MLLAEAVLGVDDAKEFATRLGSQEFEAANIANKIGD